MMEETSSGFGGYGWLLLVLVVFLIFLPAIVSETRSRMPLQAAALGLSILAPIILMGADSSALHL